MIEGKKVAVAEVKSTEVAESTSSTALLVANTLRDSHKEKGTSGMHRHSHYAIQALK